jgi:glutaredoxin 3
VAQVTLYSKTYCPYCDRAKALLAAKGVAFEEINLEGKPDEMQALVKQTGMRTVPQIFINGKLVGGFTDLAALDQQGKLDLLLAE